MEKTIKLIDFYADWCGPCKALSPILDKLAESYPQVELVKVDVEDANNEQMALDYNVLSIPKVVVEFEGKVVKTFTGAKPYPAIEADLKEWL